MSWSEEGSPKFKYLVTLLSKVNLSGIFTLLEYQLFTFTPNIGTQISVLSTTLLYKFCSVDSLLLPKYFF